MVITVEVAREELMNILFTGNLQRYADYCKVPENTVKTNEVKFIIKKTNGYQITKKA